MGRPSNYFARKCEEHRSVDLASLRRRGMLADSGTRTLTWSRGGEITASIGVVAVERGVHLIYRVRERDGDWQDVDELIPYVWTPTQFGGRRQWLQCPGCSKRCRIVYSGTRFRCRRCLQLRSASQYEPPGLGGVDQADKIRKRLGDNDGSAFEQDEFPPKPKGMHWKTYRRLEQRYDDQQFRWTRAALAKFGFTGL